MNCTFNTNQNIIKIWRSSTNTHFHIFYGLHETRNKNLFQSQTHALLLNSPSLFPLVIVWRTTFSTIICYRSNVISCWVWNAITELWATEPAPDRLAWSRKYRAPQPGMKVISAWAFFHSPCSFINLFTRLIFYISVICRSHPVYFSLSVQHLTSNRSSFFSLSLFFPSPYSNLIPQVFLCSFLPSVLLIFYHIFYFQKRVGGTQRERSLLL